ncbi:MAG: hypothetical protein EAZ81_04575 [Verrucomicrobia bacterium]|nr:MAG: hypothetical protein EAZ81_04575 [Verrucomicrobiota bacterium]
MEREFRLKHMKAKTKQYAKLLIGGAALMMTSAATAEEEVIEPQIAICDFFPLPEVVDETVSEENVTVVEEFTEGEVSEKCDEVVIDAPEVITDEGVVFTCWNVDWVKRENDDVTPPEYLAMTASGPMTESSGAAAQPSAPQTADEQSAVTQVEKNTVSSQISRVASKPTAVKSDGRVFLR